MRRYVGSLVVHLMDGSAARTDTWLRVTHAKGISDDRTTTVGSTGVVGTSDNRAGGDGEC